MHRRGRDPPLDVDQATRQPEPSLEEDDAPRPLRPKGRRALLPARGDGRSGPPTVGRSRSAWAPPRPTPGTTLGGWARWGPGPRGDQHRMPRSSPRAPTTRIRGPRSSCLRTAPPHGAQPRCPTRAPARRVRPASLRRSDIIHSRHDTIQLRGSATRGTRCGHGDGFGPDVRQHLRCDDLAVAQRDLRPGLPAPLAPGRRVLFCVTVPLQRSVEFCCTSLISPRPT